MKTSNLKMPSIGFLRINKVLQFYPVSKSKWWMGVKSGEFPKPHKLSDGITAWAVEDIRALIHKVKEQRQ